MQFAISYLAGRLLALFLFSFLVFASLFSTEIAAAEKEKQDPPMTFVVVRDLRCSDTCPEWISAEGQITSATPALLKKVLKAIGKQKMPVVLNSPGGDVDAAYKMGRMIRKAGLETTVGHTWLNDCPPQDKRCKAGIGKDGRSTGYSHPFRAGCFSACPLVLAGGTVRALSRWTYIGLHQITVTYRRVRVSYEVEYAMVNGRRKEVSRKEIGRKVQGRRTSTTLNKKDKAELTAYLREMGISPDAIDVMMSTPPDDMRIVPSAEALKLGLITDILIQREWPGMSLCRESDSADALCHRRAAPKAAPGPV
ncbi:hypothetical protein KX729_16570 [Rhizobium sp. XQZ8]|uniref:COG3904 family protein n=1 Tax=Rhizobium populisoli TaxID=2859785 RepID=UPI001CA58D15|nr:hypothetical protein [Rhizobium populisoli]MBW6423074.1 hypothetical protein [Rhizobium populisoli]